MSITKVPATGVFHGGAAFRLTPPAGNNTKGSWLELHSGIPEDCVGILVTVVSPFNPLGAAQWRGLFDLGIGTAGAETAIIENMMVGFGDAVVSHNMWAVYIPLHLDSGTRIAGRMQSSNTTLGGGINLKLQLVGGSVGGYNTATTYGATTGTSRGTTIDCGASANTYSAYQTVVASTTRAIDWLVVQISGRDNTAPQNTSFAFDIATGGAGSEVIIAPQLEFNSHAGDNWQPTTWTFPAPGGTIPAGTRLSVRAKSGTNDATDRLFDVIIVGLDEAATVPDETRITQAGHATSSQNASAESAVTQAGHASVLQFTDDIESRVTQIGGISAQTAGPTVSRITQTAALIIWIPEPTPEPPVVSSCPLDDFPVGSGTDDAGCPNSFPTG